MEDVDKGLQSEISNTPENEVQAKLGQVFNRASRLIEQGEFLFPKEARKPNPSFGFFYKNKRLLLIIGRRYKDGYIDDSTGRFKLTETTDEIQRVSFGIHFSATERMQLRFMKAPGFPKDCSLVVKKLDDGTFRGIIQEDDMGKLLKNKKTNDVNLADIPPAAANLILEKRISFLAQSPIGAKASPSGEMRMFTSS